MSFAIGIVLAVALCVGYEVSVALQWKEMFFARNRIGRNKFKPAVLKDTYFTTTWKNAIQLFDFGRWAPEIVGTKFVTGFLSLFVRSSPAHSGPDTRMTASVIPGQIDTTRWHQEWNAHLFSVMHDSNPDSFMYRLRQEVDVVAKIMSTQYAQDFKFLRFITGTNPVKVLHTQVLCSATEGCDALAVIKFRYCGGAKIETCLTTWEGDRVYYRLTIAEADGMVMVRLPAYLDEFYSLSFVDLPQYEFDVEISTDGLHYETDTDLLGLGHVTKRALFEVIKSNDVLPKEFKFSYQFSESKYLHQAIGIDGHQTTAQPAYQNPIREHDFNTLNLKRDSNSERSSSTQKIYCELCVDTISTKYPGVICGTCSMIVHKKCATNQLTLRSCVSLVPVDTEAHTDGLELRKVKSSKVKEREIHLTDSNTASVTSLERRRTESPNRRAAATLRVKVLRAQNTSPRDSNGLSDPFCLVSLASEQFRTKKVANTLNPVFKEVFLFDLQRGEVPLLRVAVYDWNRMGKSEFMGCICLNLQSLRPDVKEQGTYALDAWGDNVSVTGGITLSFKLIPAAKIDRVQEADYRTQFPLGIYAEERSMVMPSPLARNMYKFFRMHTQLCRSELTYLMTLIRLRDGFFRRTVQQKVPGSAARELETLLDRIIETKTGQLTRLINSNHLSHRCMHMGQLTKTIEVLDEVCDQWCGISDWLRTAAPYLQQLTTPEIGQEILRMCTQDCADEVDALPLNIRDWSQTYIADIRKKVVDCECYCTDDVFRGVAEEPFDFWHALRSPYHRATEYDLEFEHLFKVVRNDERLRRLRETYEDIGLTMRSGAYEALLTRMSALTHDWTPAELRRLHGDAGSEEAPLVLFGDMQWYPNKTANSQRVTLWLFEGLLLLTVRYSQSQLTPRLCAEPIWLLDIAVELVENEEAGSDQADVQLLSIVSASGKVWLLRASSEVEALLWKARIVACSSVSPPTTKESSEDWLDLLKKFPRLVKLRRSSAATGSAEQYHSLLRAKPANLSNTMLASPLIRRSRSISDRQPNRANSSSQLDAPQKSQLSVPGDESRNGSTTSISSNSPILRKRCSFTNNEGKTHNDGYLLLSEDGTLVYQKRNRIGLKREKVHISASELSVVHASGTSSLHVTTSTGETYDFDDLSPEDRDVVTTLLVQTMDMQTNNDLQPQG